MTLPFKLEEEDDMANPLTPMTSTPLPCWHFLPSSQLLWEQVYGCTSRGVPSRKGLACFCLKLWSRPNKTTFTMVKSIASLFLCHSILQLSNQLWLCNILEN